MKKSIVLTIALLALPACQHKTDSIKRHTLNFKNTSYTTSTTKKLDRPQITIWIHGTRGFKGLDEWVHAAPPTNKLQPVTALSKRYTRFKNMATAIATADPTNYPLEHFYVYGWSGDLSFTERRKAAQLLHDQLDDLVASYLKNYGVIPFIRLITHSHGGNVALNLATSDHTKSSWRINEAILLACPVQNKTKHLIEHELFDRIYSLYSTTDTIQVVDPQGLYKKELVPHSKELFSQRIFPYHKKLIQTKIRINKHGVPHTNFTFCSFLQHLPVLIHHLAEWEEQEPHTANEVRQVHLRY